MTKGYLEVLLITKRGHCYANYYVTGFVRSRILVGCSTGSLVLVPATSNYGGAVPSWSDAPQFQTAYSLRKLVLR